MKPEYSLSNLRNLAELIGGLLNDPTMEIEKTFQGYRLVSHNGSRNVSPILSKANLYDWLHAFKEGIYREGESK